MKRSFRNAIVYVVFIAIIIIATAALWSRAGQTQKIHYSDVVEYFKNGDVKSFEVDKDNNISVIELNMTCPGTLVNRIVNFVSRDCMDIKGFGTEYIRKLTEEKYIQDIADVFELKDKRDALIEGKLLGLEKNTDKLLAAIETAKTETPADKVLAGLGIPGVGKATAKELIRTFGSIDSIAEADKDALSAVQDIGEISAEGIYNFFHDEGNKQLMARLKDLGLNFAKAEGEVQGSALAGLTFCITGTLEGMSRSEAESLIESNGGKPVSSVSKKTSYLLMGADAGSKERKARELGVPIIGLDELKDMIAKE